MRRSRRPHRIYKRNKSGSGMIESDIITGNIFFTGILVFWIIVIILSIY